MEHIQKYKIEDESLDDQPDNFIASQNNYVSSNMVKKNNIQNNIQGKTIKVSQPKMQINDIGTSEIKKISKKLITW